MHSIHYDRVQARLFLQTSGIWDAAGGMAAEMEICVACRDAVRAGRKLSILVDVDSFVPNTTEFRTIQTRTTAALRRAPIERIAVIAARATMRMRVLCQGAQAMHRIFPDAASAIEWLGWSTEYVAVLPWMQQALSRQADHLAA